MNKERYPQEWFSVPSVTEILSAFPGPQLIAWYRRMAFSDQKAVSEKSLDIGKTLHELRQRIEKGEPFEITTQYPVEVQNCIKSYFQWKKERSIPPIKYSELQMFNAKLGFKGTLDDLAVQDGKAVLLEYKTAKGIYDDALEQAIAYKQLLEHPMTQFLEIGFQGSFVNEIWVVRFGKEKSEYESVQIKDSEMPELWESFRCKMKILEIRAKREAANARSKSQV